MKTYTISKFIASGGTGLIFLLDDGIHVIKIINKEGIIKEEIDLYNQIMKTKKIYKKNLPLIKVIPISTITNYKLFMKKYDYHNYPHNKALVLNYCSYSLDVGLCKNINVTDLQKIESCNKTLIWSDIYLECISLIKTVASMNHAQFFHNDIKLENILICNGKYLRLIDFGLTFKLDADKKLYPGGYGYFINSYNYNYSVATLRAAPMPISIKENRYKYSYHKFLNRYISNLNDYNFDKIYTAIYGIEEYIKYLEILDTYDFIDFNYARYTENIDSFGLGIILLYLYHFSIRDGDNTDFTKVIYLLLAQDVNVQISPYIAYKMLMPSRMY